MILFRADTTLSESYKTSLANFREESEEYYNLVIFNFLIDDLGYDFECFQ